MIDAAVVETVIVVGSAASIAFNPKGGNATPNAAQAALKRGSAPTIPARSGAGVPPVCTIDSAYKLIQSVGRHHEFS
jgi:hypothetical protein